MGNVIPVKARFTTGGDTSSLGEFNSGDTIDGSSINMLLSALSDVSAHTGFTPGASLVLSSNNIWVPSGGTGGVDSVSTLTDTFFTSPIQRTYLTLEGERWVASGPAEVSATTPDVAIGKIWLDTASNGTVVETYNISTVSESATLTNSHTTLICSGTITLTLPAAAGNVGKVYHIHNKFTGTVTIDGNGAETINGSTTAVISVQYNAVTIISDNIEWWII